MLKANVPGIVQHWHSIRVEKSRCRRFRYPAPRPRGQVDAADHEGDEDGRRVEAAPRAGAHPAGAAVRDRDAARAEQPGDARRSVAAPAARRAAGAARGRQGAAVRHLRGPRPVRQLQHQRDQGAPARSSSRTRRAKWRSASSAAAAATISRGAASRSATSRSTCSPASSSRTRRASPTPRSRRSRPGRSTASTWSTTSSSRSCRSGSWSSGCCRSRGSRWSRRNRSPGSTSAGRRPAADRLSLRADAGGAVQHAHPAARRGPGVPRAARVERRVLRRADDGDGLGLAQRVGHDRPAHALHEQGPPGGDHARDHRSGFGRRAL